ncbi:MAG: MFS transporter [Clostridia bacterium]
MQYDERQGKRLFWLCWLAYFASYIGRQNYSAAMADMIAAGVLTTTQGGAVSTAFFLCYAVGQIVNGIAADHLRPARMLLCGLASSAVLNLMVSQCSSGTAMMVLWGLNGFANAMLWPPIIRIFAVYLSQNRREKAGIHISSTMPAGTIASYVIAAAMMRTQSWREIFIVSALCIGVVVVIFALGTRGQLRSPGIAEPQKNAIGRLSIVSLLGMGIGVAILPTMIHGCLKDGVNAWVPAMLSGTYQLSGSTSALLSTLLPVVNVAGAYLGGYVYRKLGRRELLAAGCFFAIACAGFVLMALPLNGGAALMTLLFALTTTCMLAVNTLFINILPMRFASRGITASISGALNAIAYLGAALSTLGVGALMQLGPMFPIYGWILLSALAMVICTVGGRKVRATPITKMHANA